MATLRRRILSVLATVQIVPCARDALGAPDRPVPRGAPVTQLLDDLLPEPFLIRSHVPPVRARRGLRAIELHAQCPSSRPPGSSDTSASRGRTKSSASGVVKQVGTVAPKCRATSQVRCAGVLGRRLAEVATARFRFLLSDNGCSYFPGSKRPRNRVESGLPGRCNHDATRRDRSKPATKLPPTPRRRAVKGGPRRSG
jgi:hypothetical protein